MNWKYILIVVILTVLVGGGILVYQYRWMPDAYHWRMLGGGDRSQTAGQIVCDLYEEAKLDYKSCFCGTDSSKNKIAVIIKKNGIYDNEEIEQVLNRYFSSVKKDLGIDSVEIAKFSGATVPALDVLIESLYLQNDVKYLILVGEDLPVFENPENLNLIWDKLEYVGRAYSMVEYRGPNSEKLPKPAFVSDCKDVIISTVPGPVGDVSTKTAFIKKVFNNFTWMHDNFDSLKDIYKNKILAIEWDETLGSPLGEMTNLDFYTLPKQRLKNTEHENIQTNLKEQPIILTYYVHGSPYVITIGLGSREYEKFNTSLEEYRTFFKINNINGPLFVDAFTCGSAWPIAWENQENTEFCCWPQASLDTGTWIYYGASGSYETIGSVVSELSKGKTFGDALLVKPHWEFKVYGDILAHLPIF